MRNRNKGHNPTRPQLLANSVKPSGNRTYEPRWSPPPDNDELIGLRLENARLKAEVDIKNAMVEGGLPKVIDLLAQERVWREEAQQDRDWVRDIMLNLINQATITVQTDEEKTLAEYIEEVNLFTAEHKDYVPVPMLLVQATYKDLEKKSVHAVNAITTSINDQGADLQAVLLRALWIAYLNGQRTLAINGFRRLREQSRNPYLVCCEILQELHYLKHTLFETVNRLDEEWVKDNISSRLGNSQATLCEAINTAYRCKKSPLTQQEFAANQPNLTYENLCKMVGYFNKVQTNARNAPDEVKKLFPEDIFE